MALWMNLGVLFLFRMHWILGWREVFGVRSDHWAGTS